jgi:predicted DNA-binding WGR domain protein/3-methyladenine DNA glycosylase AlkC
MSDVVYLECVEDGASKFWSGTVKGKVLTTRWGKIGTQGQSKEETFADVAASKASLDKQAAAKTKKGYTAAAGAPAAAPAPAKSSPRAAKATPAAAKASKPRSAPTKPPAPTTKPLLTAWLKDTSRTGAELASAEGRFPETDRLIAAHTLALPETLSKLSHSSDKATRAKVAANPNAPPADYVRLGQQFPKEFIQNPLLDLLLLEQPALLQEVPSALLVQITKRPECPADFLVWAAAHTDQKVQLAVAMNSQAPEVALMRLRQSAHGKVRESVISGHSSQFGDPEILFREAVRERLAALTPEEAKEAWEKKYIGLPQYRELSLRAQVKLADVENQIVPVTAAVAANPSLPLRLLVLLAEYGDSSVRASVAGNPSAPVALVANLLKSLAKDSERSARYTAALNPHASIETLESLASDKDPYVRSCVAKNPNTPSQLRTMLLETLASDTDPYVLRWVAVNPDTPSALRKKLLRILARDTDQLVRGWVAKNPNTPAAMLEALARDTSRYVRMGVAENPNTPIALLDALARDTDDGPRSSVATNPNTPVAILEALAGDTWWYVRSSVAKNPSTPPALREALFDVLQALLEDRSNSGVRSEVARNPYAPIVMLEKLARDNDDVREHVADNPGTPAALLVALANDDNPRVRSAVARNPKTPVAVLEQIASSLVSLAEQLRTNPLATPRIAKLLAKPPPDQRKAFEEGNFLFFTGKDPNKAVLSNHLLGTVLALCAGPFVEPSRIARVAGSTEWLVRAAVARNRGTPPAVLKKLGADVHPVVRSMALTKTTAHAEARSAAVNVTPDVATAFDHLRVKHDIQRCLKTKRAWPVRFELLTSPGVPAPLLEVMATKDQAARCWVGSNPETPVRVLAHLAKSKNSWIRRSVARNPSTPLVVVESLARDKDKHVRRSVADNPDVPLELCGALLAALAEDPENGYQSVRSSVAENPKTPVAVLEALAKDKDEYVRRSVVKNPNTSVALLGALARDTSRYVRMEVAWNPNTPVALLEALSKDKNEDVRRGVAENAKTPVSVLEVLCKDKDSGVRGLVAKSVNTPISLLEAMSKDKHEDVRRGVARNRRTPVEVLEALSEDKDKYVRRNVACNPSMPWESAEALLESPAIEVDWPVRRCVADNPNTPPELREALLELMVKFHSDYRCSVARNPNTPVAMLRTLAKDNHWDVRRAVADNPNTPVAVLDELKADKAHLFSDALSLLCSPGNARLPESSVLRWLERLLDFPRIPDNKALTKASRDKNWLLRLGVALHPEASDAMLELLIGDPDADVAVAARLKLAERESTRPAQ